MPREVYVVIVCFGLFVIVCSGPVTQSDSGIIECYTIKCPNHTNACEKRIKISEDKLYLLTEIHCLGFDGNILKEQTLSEKNPFDNNTSFQGYSYSRSYAVRGGGSR